MFAWCVRVLTGCPVLVWGVCVSCLSMFVFLLILWLADYYHRSCQTHACLIFQWKMFNVLSEGLRFSLSVTTFLVLVPSSVLYPLYLLSFCVLPSSHLFITVFLLPQMPNTVQRVSLAPRLVLGATPYPRASAPRWTKALAMQQERWRVSVPP